MIQPPNLWQYTNEGYVICPSCCESMNFHNADFPTEHSPDCEYIEQRKRIMELTLEIGKTYQFTHIRKGSFRAQLIDIMPADTGDEQDKELLQVKIDTRKGSGQDRLARSNASVTVTNIRPSLITHIEQMPDDTWLMENRVQEEQKREEKQYENDLKNMVKTVLKEAETNKKPGFFDRISKKLNRKN